MKKKAILIGLILCTLNAWGQVTDLNNRDSAVHYLKIGKSKRVDHLEIEAISAFNISLGFCQSPKSDTIRSELYMNIAGSWAYLCMYDSSEVYQRKSLDLCSGLYGEKSIEVAKCLNNFAGLFAARWDIEKSISLRLEALEMIKNIDPGNKNIPIICNNLGNLYAVKRDIIRSKVFYEQAIRFLSKSKGEENLKVVVYNNYAYILAENQHMKMAWTMHGRADSIIQLGNIHPDHILNHIDIRGDLFFFDKNLDSSIICHERYLSTTLSLSNPNKSLLAATYGKLAERYFLKNDLENSKVYALKSIGIADEIRNGKGSGLVQGFRLLGTIMQRNSKHELALDYFDKSLRANNYSYQTIKDFWLPDEGFKTLIEMSKTYTSIGDYTRSMEVVKRADSTLMMEYFRLDALDSKFKFLDDARGFYENLIENIYTKNRSFLPKKDVFYYVEQLKSKILYSSILELDALHFSGIPDSIIMREQSIKREISVCERKKNEVANPLKEQEFDFISEKIIHLTVEYDRLLEHLENKYKNYYDLKYELRTETVETVQHELLQPGQTMLEYFTGDSSIFIFVLRKDLYEVVEVPRDFPLEDWVKSMRSGIADWWAGKIPEDQYAASLSWYGQAAYDLYQKLVAPVARFIPAGDQIIVIPDGILAYIPFEALLTAPAPADSTRFHEYKYWVLHHDISYCYSATLLREMRTRKHKTIPKYDFLGVAPTFAGSSTSIPSSYLNFEGRFGHESLKYNVIEVDSIQQILGGQIFTGSDATEKCFADTAWAFRIIHTSLHGESNDRSGDYSFLAFYETPDSVENEWLYVREVYNLSLNADLVTLSACQTGLGELRRGEGIIGLTRAFTYAGAKSIVNTLWSIDDKRTMLLMTQFYRNLKAGQEKDVALANAKRNSIRKGGLWAHPVFWAGFIGIGDMGAIN